jgi:hypothetical protein
MWVGTSTPRPLYLEERTPGTHRLGRVGPRAGQDVVAKRKNSIIAPAVNWTQIVQQVARLTYAGSSTSDNGQFLKSC